MEKPLKPIKEQEIWKLGEQYFIRCEQQWYTGVLEYYDNDVIVLKKCSWIVDTGGFTNAIESGKFDTVEPFPAEDLVHIRAAKICDWIVWKHPLPRE